MRASKPRSDAGRAARLLYLNKCGYNGLYRVNQRGEFNVPYGHHKKPPEILDEEAIYAAFSALRIAEVHARDVLLSGGAAMVADFVYLDPPYWPTSPTASFTAYAGGRFSPTAQRALALRLRQFARLGVPALLSNSDVPETRKLYAGFEIKRVSARRNVNSVGTGRGKVSELLVAARLKKVTRS